MKMHHQVADGNAAEYPSNYHELSQAKSQRESDDELLRKAGKTPVLKVRDGLGPTPPYIGFFLD